MDGIICPLTLPLELMLFDIWIQVSVLADLTQDVINSSVVYLVPSCMCLSGLDITLQEDLVLSCGRCNSLAIMSLSGVEYL